MINVGQIASFTYIAGNPALWLEILNFSKYNKAVNLYVSAKIWFKKLLNHMSLKSKMSKLRTSVLLYIRICLSVVRNLDLLELFQTIAKQQIRGLPINTWTRWGEGGQKMAKSVCWMTPKPKLYIQFVIGWNSCRRLKFTSHWLSSTRQVCSHTV